ncbi:unnamed protein product, partial [Musa banksii]
MKDYDRADARNKLVGLGRDYDSEEDQQRERESQDYEKDYHRNPESHKNDKVASHEELRGYDKDSTDGKDTSAPQLKKADSNNKMDFSKQTKETHEKVNSETLNSSINDAESTNDVNSAKVAALKAAELGEGKHEPVVLEGLDTCPLTKRKSHFGVTKRTALTEESSSCWDFHLFSNQESQEKFNRLMVISILQLFYNHVPCTQIGHEACKSSSKEIHADLEKQYTAGLRRRDGRT